MNEKEIIIIGAGAAGLAAGRELVENGYKVTILEARNRIGGRIHTLHDSSFSTHVEAGAEFVHGDLPYTQAIIKGAGLSYTTANGSMWQSENGELSQGQHFIKDWDLFESQIKELKTDVTINEFLETHFKEAKYDKLKDAVRRYAAGYDNADPERVSAIALRDEWLGEDDSKQYRITDGYNKLVQYLANEIENKGGTIQLLSIVKEIRWQKDKVEVTDNKGTIFRAHKAIITVPLNILQGNENDTAYIKFFPALPEKLNAARQMGMGNIIKILLEFDSAFWNADDFKKQTGKDLRDMIFLFSHEEIPTWWTQYPDKIPLLTGWLGGKPAEDLIDVPCEEILARALASLAAIFKYKEAVLRKKLTAWEVINWTADPFTKGSYSYATIDTKAAVKILGEPVADTMFFAGEAFYEGIEMGTVEAALANGTDVAKNIIKMHTPLDKQIHEP